MTDNYGRTIDYMRVSITDRCNLRCRYCMPDGIRWIPMEEILTLEEITEVCRQGAALGIRKIKLTGGEPLVRKGCTDLVGMLKEIPGIEQVTLTTNGVLLDRYAEELYKKGLDAVNISLDTLDAERYAEITGTDALDDVLRGIQAMEQYPIPLKLNVVPQRGRNESACVKLAEFARDQSIDVRFIEMMPIGHGKEFETVSNGEIRKLLEEHYGTAGEDEKVHGNGPAVYYRLPGFLGSIGFISAIHGKFCGQCNRIRLTSVGQIKPCLCYGDGISVKEAVRSGRSEEVRRLIEKAVECKPRAHVFENRCDITEKREMARIGG